ncbi:MAG TPA: hypothetical protein VGA61_10440 [Anaerolineae bacterium]
MERRALEAAFQELAETDSLDQLAERAQAIAGHGSAVLPVLVGLLDTADPQVRGGLGQVAVHLNREQIVPALRAVARARDRSDHARLTAMMILDRYLHEPVDESLMAGLQDPDEVAAQSLRELSHEMERNPFVALEYLNQLGEQPAEVAGMVLDAIPGLGPDPHLITLLRLFAQGPDLVLAQKAIEQIGRTRAPEAAQALASLSQTLPPMLAGMANRGLRKLRLMGVPAPEPAPTAGLRALLSPIDGSGAQVVWFVSAATEGAEHPEHGTLLSVLCKDPEGIIASFGSTDVPVAELPPPLPPGGEYLIRQGEDGPAIRMLEVGADAGRVVVRDALHLLWQRGAAAPPEYRLLNPLIWNASALADLPAASERPATGTPGAAAALLDQADFASWFWHAEPAYTEAEALGRRPSAAQHAAAVDRLIAAHFDAALTASYARRLAGMARWLEFAGQSETAALAEAAASYMASLPPAKNPFCRRLVGIGLDVASANLRSGFDLRQQQNTP